MIWDVLYWGPPSHRHNVTPEVLFSIFSCSLRQHRSLRSSLCYYFLIYNFFPSCIYAVLSSPRYCRFAVFVFFVFLHGVSCRLALSLSTFFVILSFGVSRFFLHFSFRFTHFILCVHNFASVCVLSAFFMFQIPAPVYASKSSALLHIIIVIIIIFTTVSSVIPHCLSTS